MNFSELSKLVATVILSIIIVLPAVAAVSPDPNQASADALGTTSDSTQVKPQTTSTLNIKYPSQTVTSPAIDNNSWPQPCPATISDCPDINVDPNSAAYDPPSCPKACSVTQSNYSQTGPVGDFKNAVCPAGYTQVAAFNSQPEYAWSPNPPSKWPVDMSQYNQYIATPGYSCAGNGSSLYWEDNCGASRKWGNQAITDQLPAAPSNVVYIVNINEKCYTKGSSCGARIGCDQVAQDSQYTYQYQAVVCTAPPGNYPTGNYIPGSVACARITPTWGSH